MKYHSARNRMKTAQIEFWSNRKAVSHKTKQILSKTMENHVLPWAYVTVIAFKCMHALFNTMCTKVSPSFSKENKKVPIRFKQVHYPLATIVSFLMHVTLFAANCMFTFPVIFCILLSYASVQEFCIKTLHFKQ